MFNLSYSDILMKFVSNFSTNLALSESLLPFVLLSNLIRFFLKSLLSKYFFNNYSWRGIFSSISGRSWKYSMLIIYFKKNSHTTNSSVFLFFVF